MSKARRRRTFSHEFKKHVIDLYESGHSRKEIIEKYELTPSAFDRWVSQYKKHGHFKDKPKLTEAEKEYIRLKKELEELKMERAILLEANEILKKFRNK